MLIPGTQMNITTFAFVCIELVIFFYLLIYKLARPDDKKAIFNIWLVVLLLIYNITGGLLPDPNMPGPVFLQEIIAYATGFITPSFFPYYVYKVFDLKKMKFHAFYGVYIFLLIPFLCFCFIYKKTNNLGRANNILIIPVLYAAWVIISLIKALNKKYNGKFDTYQSKEEFTGLLLSLSPWVSLPIITIFDLGQTVEASVTNPGFLLLLALHLKNHISQSRKEHQRLIHSEKKLLNWNSTLKAEVDKRTEELTVITNQRTNTLINLAHETRTPLTLLKNYMDEYSSKRKGSEELTIVRKSIDKLTSDITNLLDIEKFERGLPIYDHSQITSFTQLLEDNLPLFIAYAKKRAITIDASIAQDVYVQSDPMAINRLINNLIDNAIKYSSEGKKIFVTLQKNDSYVEFSVSDQGYGIPEELKEKVFQPYYQINHKKKSSQGLGLGLPIVKKVVDSLTGKLLIKSQPAGEQGTKIILQLKNHQLTEHQKVSQVDLLTPKYDDEQLPLIPQNSVGKRNILIVEDNSEMAYYLHLKLKEYYAIYIASNGIMALDILRQKDLRIDLIVSDVMMDEMDGYTLAEIISKDENMNYIPFLFLTARSNIDDKLLALDLGAIDFITKPFSIVEFQKKIKSILQNTYKQRHIFYQSAIKAILSLDEEGTIDLNSGGSDHFERNCSVYNLTPREKVIAKMILDGVNYRTIGESLFIAERTVTTHVQHIFEKVRVSNKIELINKLIA
jgi:signal transduction histidine kinase/DNA-binding NarL/FixJ family response regulator